MFAILVVAAAECSQVKWFPLFGIFLPLEFVSALVRSIVLTKTYRIHSVEVIFNH